MLYTTFAKLHDAGACAERYKHLAKQLGGIEAYGRETPISLLQILDLNGLDDALWALQAVPDSERFSRLLACDFAEHVLPIFEEKYPNDKRPRRAIEVSRRFAKGEATADELDAARDTARDATWAAMDAARAAAWAASWAAMAAAGDAVWAAAGDARAAAGDAERQWQEARFREMLEGGE